MVFGRDSLVEYFKAADKGGWAVPSLNFADAYDLTAIVEAANEEKAPIMLSVPSFVLDIIGHEMVQKIYEGALVRAKYPLYLHLDHAKEMTSVFKAIRVGFSSVMVDASLCSLEENINKVRQAADVAHAVNVQVEAEIGKICGAASYEGGQDTDFLADPAEARELAERSGLDSLAVGIGTAHGIYKGKPQINFERLKEINAAVEAPLVMHGGTGIPEEDIKRAIKNGINRVNIGTIIHTTYMNNMKEQLEIKGLDQYPWDIVPVPMSKTKEVAREAIRMCMANGKA